jgi:Uma2 family endonuclease
MNTARPAIPEADLLAIADRVEVVAGKVVPMSPVGGLHQIVSGNVYDILRAFAVRHKLGWVVSDGLLFLLERDSVGVRGARVPDVAYIRRERIPKDWDLQKPFPSAPDLAVEVMSPSDTAGEVMERVQDYLRANTQEVWVLYPNTRQLLRHMQGEAVVYRYEAGDSFTSPLFAGLTLDIDSFFNVPDWLFEAD